MRLIPDGGEIQHATVDDPPSDDVDDDRDVDDRDRIDRPEVDCPICGEYRGRIASVEAHINGKRDDAHRGELGFDYRDEMIRAQADAVDDADALDDDHADADPDDPPEAECPECGKGLGMTENEAHEFIVENDGGWCDGCGAKLVVRGGTEA